MANDSLIPNVLIPLDGTPGAEKALPLGRALAERAGSNVVLVAVGSDEVETERAARYLAGVSERESFSGETKVVARTGDPATEIISEAKTQRSDLIVMTEASGDLRGPGEVGRVTSRVLLGSPSPVLITRRTDSPPVPEEILVLLDGSRLSELSLGISARLARTWGARLRLSVILTESESQFASIRPRWSRDDAGQASAKAYLDKQAAKPDFAGLEVVGEVTGGGDNQFVGWSGPAGARIVAVTTRGESGFSRWVLGGAADHIIRSSPHATLVVPPRHS